MAKRRFANVTVLRRCCGQMKRVKIAERTASRRRWQNRRGENSFKKQIDTYANNEGIGHPYNVFRTHMGGGGRVDGDLRQPVDGKRTVSCFRQINRATRFGHIFPARRQQKSNTRPYLTRSYVSFSRCRFWNETKMMQTIIIAWMYAINVLNYRFFALLSYISATGRSKTFL